MENMIHQLVNLHQRLSLLAFKKNGSTFSYGQIFSGGSNAEIGATISGTIDLDADDDVRVDVYQGSGSSKNLPANGCVFSAYRIIGA